MSSSETDLRDMLDQWLFNVELECGGGSLWPIEEIAVGGAVLKMADLLKVLRYASRLSQQSLPSYG